MWVRRALVTGVIVASLVAGGAGAATAADGGAGHAEERCARLASGTGGVDREVARIEAKIQRLSTAGVAGGQGRIHALEARKAKIEQRLAALKASCNA